MKKQYFDAELLTVYFQMPDIVTNSPPNDTEEIPYEEQQQGGGN